MADQNLVALITVLALALCMWALIRVSLARARFGILAPATVGHPEFERHFRVHMNTLESLALFLPSLWLFAQYWSQWAAAGLGAVWLLGRVLYMFGYVKDPKGRALGFMIQGGATTLLLLGALAGVVRALFSAGG
ncbi:putative membrane protein YecN with MAPEG domain [Caulobacter ginsengisoli]|uniref:Membrane protein YecN with MAPEG domain n=1 Tax=Caulobacter ginsengisoli TaxID=400775 RepID=A0ABU0IP47_9CAUL|nr:MAPEG family protein [Caulobacter ginsengisoli]MDQ0463781.1 putative membrane protein YecN with MAPEG domain [Caulobacter ginsengisoli]